MDTTSKFKAWMKNLQDELNAAQLVRVGFLAGSTAGWTGPRPIKPNKKWKRTETPSYSVSSNPPAAYIASIMEYGYSAGGIPPRPFFSTMINEKKSGWPTLLAAALHIHKFNARLTLETVGLKLKEELQLSILRGNWEAETYATIDKKGFSQPLVDSHNMINAVDFEVL